MARLFEVTKRDGAARLGKLSWRDEELATPYSFESREELQFLKELTIHKAEIDVTVVAAQEETSTEQIDADVVILAGAARFRGDPRGLTKALLEARALANPDSALYVPALATPTNVSLLVYAGVDLVDTVMAEVKAREGYFLDADGERRFEPEQMRDAPAEERHDGVMRDEPDADRARHLQHPLEIVHAQRDAHAEHDDRESPRDVLAAEPGEPRRMNQRQRAARQNPDREKIGGQGKRAVHGRVD